MKICSSYYSCCNSRAVDEHADLLRLSASTPGNDHRLGANEAPPAIISVFSGEQLEDVVEQFVDNGEATSSLEGEEYISGVHSLPHFQKDATDRNRTSPFAFTGNKFEFRMVGPHHSLSQTLTQYLTQSLQKYYVTWQTN